MAPPLPPKRLLRAIYRSLLRTSKPFSSPTMAGLLHRSGITHDWHECIHHLQQARMRRNELAKLAADGDNIEKDDPSAWHLPKDWAQNLSRSYTDLKEEYALRRDFFQNQYKTNDATELERGEEFIDMTMGSSDWREIYDNGDLGIEDPNIILFRHLFREWSSGSDRWQDILNRELEMEWSVDGDGFVPYMRWPSQIANDKMSLRDLIRREFHAPTVDERCQMESEAKTDDGKSKSELYFPPSSYIDNHYRVCTAFRALMELNRKLAWGEKLGLVTSSSNEELRHRKRLMQAAKGVTPFPPSTSESTIETQHQNCPLQCGTYLVAHPLMTGYFARSVIILLNHTASSNEANKSIDEIKSGGTYGLIINRLALQPISQEKRLEMLRQQLEERMHAMEDDSDSDEMRGNSSTLLDIMKSTSSTGAALRRPITLIHAIQPNDLPESVQSAFGGSPLREGGPVNLSLQMIHRRCPGSTEDNSNQTNDWRGAVDKPQQSVECEIGGTQIRTDDDTLETDAIYFGGDIVKASLKVNEGSADQDDFSFIVGASCWTSGQLQREIDRGCWLPFRGPAQMAMTGMCEHNDIGEENNDEKTTMLSMYPPRPSNSTTIKHSKNKFHERPSSDLWLSVMCSLGEGEGALAFALSSERNVLDELGDVCDNFDR